MTSEVLGEMFEGDSADMSAGKFTLSSMGGRAEGLACADPGARTPIGVSGSLHYICIYNYFVTALSDDDDFLLLFILWTDHFQYLSVLN